MKCEHIVYHPQVGSKQWQMVFSDWKQCVDHGDGATAIMLGEMLFGLCEGRITEKVVEV